MPFVSKQQEKWGHSPSGLAALGGKAKVDEWQASTPKGLPERVGKLHPARVKKGTKI
jgi:hypothetical protein